MNNKPSFILLIILAFAFAIMASSCGECVPPSEEIQSCHDSGGEFDYDKCSCHK